MLPNYFNALKNQDIVEMIQEEEKFRLRGFSILTDEAIKKCTLIS
jgi:hypothetical protein